MPERDDPDPRLDRELARLAQATSDLAPGDGLAPAVMEAIARAAPAAGDAETLLARAARATSGIEPEAGFTGAVMKAVAPSRRAPLSDGLVRAGPLALGFAAALAAACLVLSFSTQSDVDAAIVASIDSVEVVE